MKIFLSWSGPRSRAVAEALSTWIPRVIQAVDVFFSPDIEKGGKWASEITGALEGTSFGIVVITRDNLASPWLHYEAGALSKLPGARVWTFLLDLANADVPPPLGIFQHTEATQDDVLKLVRSINAQVGDLGEKALADGVLAETFEDLWARFAGQLGAARDLDVSAVQAPAVGADGRGVSDKLDEVLELLRAEQRTAARLSSSQSIDTGVGRVARTLRPVFISDMSDALAIDVAHQLRRSALATSVTQQRETNGLNIVFAEISLAYVEQTLAEAITYLLQSESDIHGEPVPKWAWLRSRPPGKVVYHGTARSSNIVLPLEPQALQRDVLDLPDGSESAEG